MKKTKKEEGKFKGFVKPLTEVVEKHREWTKEEKVQIAQMMFDTAERDLVNHMNSMVDRAKRLVADLERQAAHFNQKEEKNIRKDYFQYALDEVDNCFSNYRMSDAASKLAKYEKADTLLKVFKGEVEKISLY